jgi:hypothetical protein
LLRLVSGGSDVKQLVLLFLSLSPAVVVPACGDDGPAAPASEVRVLGSGSWGSNFCTIWDFDEMVMSATLTGVPPIELMSRAVRAGDENDPARGVVVVMDAGHPDFASAVARLTDGTAEIVEARYDHVGGSGSSERNEGVFFDLLLAPDFAGREITALRFVVEKADIAPQTGGGTCAEVIVHLEVLGR